MSKVWLITGSGNGLGRDIAEAALAAGDSVVAGARRTEELAPLVAQYGERVKPVTLEVRDEVAAKAAVQLAVDTFGRLDVLVNNAGYAQAEERSHLSGVFGRWSPRGSGQYAVSRGQVGCGRFQRCTGDGSCAVRGQDLHTGAGRHSDQLGKARRSECAGLAAGLRGLGRFDAQDVA